MAVFGSSDTNWIRWGHLKCATIIIRTGTIGDRTTLIPSHIRITVATDTPHTTDAELTTAIITIVITTAIELTSLSEL